MTKYIVTGTSPVVEADDWEAAIERAEWTSGWNWEATEVKPKTFYTIHFTGEGFRTLAVYRLFFKCALEKVRAHQAAYEAEVAEWYQEHPGYQFPHCIHGSSLTTDYDNICGGCESGDSPIELAIQHARERFLRFLDRWEWACKAPGDLDYTTRNELFGWAYECFPYNARNGG